MPPRSDGSGMWLRRQHSSRGTSSPGPPYAVARGGPVPRSAPAARFTAFARSAPERDGGSRPAAPTTSRPSPPPRLSRHRFHVPPAASRPGPFRPARLWRRKSRARAARFWPGATAAAGWPDSRRSAWVASDMVPPRGSRHHRRSARASTVLSRAVPVRAAYLPSGAGEKVAPRGPYFEPPDPVLFRRSLVVFRFSCRRPPVICHGNLPRSAAVLRGRQDRQETVVTALGGSS